MYKKILVPLDGSKLAECVLEHVKGIATGCHVSEVDLLFIVEEIPASAGVTYAVSVEGQAKLKAWGKNYLAEIEKDLKGEGISIKSTVLEGKPAEVILDYVTKQDIDLIIMATHGRSGPARWAFGSVTDRVLRYSTVPVIIVAPKGCRIS